LLLVILRRDHHGSGGLCLADDCLSAVKPHRASEIAARKANQHLPALITLTRDQERQPFGSVGGHIHLPTPNAFLNALGGSPPHHQMHFKRPGVKRPPQGTPAQHIPSTPGKARQPEVTYPPSCYKPAFSCSDRILIKGGLLSDL
jgi:hypothetical protein